ncbi:MAG: N-acetyltransferase [Armatimonadota bacterium]
MKRALEYFINAGIQSMIVPVLKDNPARGFYEHMGGQYLENEVATIGDIEYNEVVYFWDNLSTISINQKSKED